MHRKGKILASLVCLILIFSSALGCSTQTNNKEDKMNEKKLIIFTDCGDTIVDETTQVRDDKEIVQTADLIPDAKKVFLQLKDEGYRICMVADGETESFKNIFEYNGMPDLFDTRTISEEVGLQKPNQEMFEDAMQKNNLSEDDKPRILMFGNNIKKDIVGANRFGITSVLIDWSKRYDMSINGKEETPDYTVHTEMEFLELVHKIEAELES